MVLIKYRRDDSMKLKKKQRRDDGVNKTQKR